MINHVARFLITASILNKHKGVPSHSGLLDGPLVGHPVHGYLRDAMAKPGIFVHWGVYGSGKTVSLSELSRSLRDKGHTVVSLNGYGMVHGNLRQLLRHSIGIPDLYKDPISDFFTCSNLTIIIDDFSPVMSVDGVYDFLQELAIDSNGRFNVLLCVNSFEWAVDILNLRWEDCPRPRLVGFPGCGRWNEAQLRELIAHVPANLEALVASSTASGVPPFASRIRAPSEIRTLDLEWQKGIQALSQLPADVFTIPMVYDDIFTERLGPGLYPDKNGKFTLA